jgi:ABC-type multidrug transport system permease subunit
MFGHLWRALRHALGKILAWAGTAFVATALLVEVVAYLAIGQRALISAPTHLAAVALALALGYAVGFMVLIAETVSLLALGAHDLEHAGVSAVERLERIEQPL